MTSQRWLTDADFDPSSEAKSLWWHILAIIVPDQIRFKNNGSLWITDGYNHAQLPGGNDEQILLAASLACETGTISGSLYQVW